IPAHIPGPLQDREPEDSRSGKLEGDEKG
ncbi:hypothetical protein V1477_006737, partial [Vespula maculifrons]